MMSMLDVDDVVVVEGETGTAGRRVAPARPASSGETVVGVCEIGLAVAVVVVVGAVPVSAETQPEGGVEAPTWPGIRTVPAHPKFEKWASSVTVPPSEKVTVDADSRMNPDPSMETRSRIVR